MSIQDIKKIKFGSQYSNESGATFTIDKKNEGNKGKPNSSLIDVELSDDLGSSSNSETGEDSPSKRKMYSGTETFSTKGGVNNDLLNVNFDNTEDDSDDDTKDETNDDTDNDANEDFLYLGVIFEINLGTNSRYDRVKSALENMELPVIEFTEPTATFLLVGDDKSNKTYKPDQKLDTTNRSDKRIGSFIYDNNRQLIIMPCKKDSESHKCFEISKKALGDDASSKMILRSLTTYTKSFPDFSYKYVSIYKGDDKPERQNLGLGHRDSSSAHFKIEEKVFINNTEPVDSPIYKDLQRHIDGVNAEIKEKLLVETEKLRQKYEENDTELESKTQLLLSKTSKEEERHQRAVDELKAKIQQKRTEKNKANVQNQIDAITAEIKKAQDDLNARQIKSASSNKNEIQERQEKIQKASQRREHLENVFEKLRKPFDMIVDHLVEETICINSLSKDKKLQLPDANTLKKDSLDNYQNLVDIVGQIESAQVELCH